MRKLRKAIVEVWLRTSTVIVRGIGEELGKKGENGVLRNLFSKITRLDSEGEIRKHFWDSQAEMEFMVVWRIVRSR